MHMYSQSLCSCLIEIMTFLFSVCPWKIRLDSISSHHHVKSQEALTSLVFSHLKMSQLTRLCYLSHRRPAKTQASLGICAVSPEPSLFAHMKYGSR